MITPFSQLNLGCVEQVRVECLVAESGEKENDIKNRITFKKYCSQEGQTGSIVFKQCENVKPSLKYQ
jgi:hypothetical protein